MVSWIYNQQEIKEVSDFPTSTFGFIYIITHIPTNKSYIGKKFLEFTRKQKLGKKELKLLEGQKGRPPKFKIVQKESDWGTYWSSNKSLKELMKVEPIENFKREILHCCNSKKQLTYFEIKYQMIYQVLEKPNEFWNDNILGKFFTKDFD
tara:strand:+ start:32 stop:481 length:450 start_codon:yes stop_codon:yes gene_type:complete